MLPKMVKMVKEWTKLPIILVADSLYSGEKTLNELKNTGIGFISRRQNTESKDAVGWDANESAPPPLSGKIKTKVGKIKFNDIPLEELKEIKNTSIFRTSTIKDKRYNAVYLHKYSEPVTIIVLIYGCS
jgi:hypothetical protein